MKNRAKIRSASNIASDLHVELLGLDDEYHDVSRGITKAQIDLEVGSLGQAHLIVRTVDAEGEAVRLDDNTLEGFAVALELHGWKVERPT